MLNITQPNNGVRHRGYFAHYEIFLDQQCSSFHENFNQHGKLS